MSDFAGMEDLLRDFLQEAGDLLSDVDNKLVELERSPGDRQLLNDIFRGFHTIKGGAGFLNAVELVKLCHLTENLFDKLRNAEMLLTPSLMDIIMAATQGVRQMFAEIGQGTQPRSAEAEIIAALRSALDGQAPAIFVAAWQRPLDAPARGARRCGTDRCVARSPNRSNPSMPRDPVGMHISPGAPAVNWRIEDNPGTDIRATDRALARL